jgi:hypothetical protein
MNEEEQMIPVPATPGEETTTPQPVNEKFRELAELEQEIRRRLRSNQRFLDKFLDEDFVDDEVGGDDDGQEEEEL